MRRGARPEDDVWVSGTLGDGALGLQVLQGALEVAGGGAGPFSSSAIACPGRVSRSARRCAASPMPRSTSPTACSPTSATSSRPRASAPSFRPTRCRCRPPPARRRARADAALAGGDDYELLFTAPPKQRGAIAALSTRLSLPLTRIGTIHAGPGLRALDAAGRELPVEHTGWQHF